MGVMKLKRWRENESVERKVLCVYIEKKRCERERESTTVEEDQWSKTTRALRNEIREIRMYSLYECARGLGTVS